MWNEVVYIKLSGPRDLQLPSASQPKGNLQTSSRDLIRRKEHQGERALKKSVPSTASEFPV